MTVALRTLTAAIAVGFLWIVLTAGAASARDRVVYQLGWLPGGDKAPAYVAQREGLFTAAGLDVTILAGKGATDALIKVATGVADIGEAPLDSVLDARAESALPVVAVMPLFTEMPDVLEIPATSNIRSFKDLIGKTVATSPYSSSTLIWPYMLKLNGIDPARVALVKADPSALPGLLASGKVDACIDWTVTAPATAAVLASVGKSMRLIHWSDFGLNGYSQSLVTSNKTLAARPDVIRRFLGAMRAAEKIMQANPARAAADVHALVPESDLATVRRQVDAARALTFNAITARDGLGVFTPARVRLTWSWVVREHDLPSGRIDPLAAVAHLSSSP